MSAVPAPAGPQLVIVLEPGGRVTVAGPIHDRALCYAMLELARDAIRDYKPSAIVAPGDFRLPPGAPA